MYIYVYTNFILQVIHSWDLSRLRMIMNPYDATSGLKMTDNGLMVI